MKETIPFEPDLSMCLRIPLILRIPNPTQQQTPYQKPLLKVGLREPHESQTRHRTSPQGNPSSRKCGSRSSSRSPRHARPHIVRRLTTQNLELKEQTRLLKKMPGPSARAHPACQDSSWFGPAGESRMVRSQCLHRARPFILLGTSQTNAAIFESWYKIGPLLGRICLECIWQFICVTTPRPSASRSVHQTRWQLRPDALPSTSSQ